MVMPDTVAFEALIKSIMGQYHQYIRTMESAWETKVDVYGDPVALVPFLKIELKDGVDILNELSERKDIKIVNRH
jgi:hypothetical protein